MRIVRKQKELKDAITSAEREAEGGFGDKRVFLERYIAKSRHIEIQILGDSHGNIIHLGRENVPFNDVIKRLLKNLLPLSLITI